MIFYVLITLILIQRLAETKVSNKNFRRIEKSLLSPVIRSEKRQMMALHSLWFISSFFEFTLHGEIIKAPLLLVGIIVLLWCQYIRYRSMNLLGESWNQLPVAYRNQTIVTSGPYKYIKHPNYLIVIIEIALIPLMGKCLGTAIIFSLLNFIFLRRRMIIEEEALNQLADYKGLNMKKKLVPFIFGLTLMSGAWASNLTINSETYAAAEESPTYFLFRGHSKKLGLFSTSFEGHARKADLTYTVNGDKIDNLVLFIYPDKLDTDNSSRNEKLWEYCLETKKYPVLKVEVSPVSLTESMQLVPGIMTVRGKKVPLKISIEKKDEKTFKGSSSFKLTEAGIPDPSIAIASVKDEFEIEFQVRLPD